MPESYMALEVHGRFVGDDVISDNLDDLAVIRSEPQPVAEVPNFTALAHRLTRQLTQYKRISNVCALSLNRLRIGIDGLTEATTELAEASDEITV